MNKWRRVSWLLLLLSILARKAPALTPSQSSWVAVENAEDANERVPGHVSMEKTTTREQLTRKLQGLLPSELGQDQHRVLKMSMKSRNVSKGKHGYYMRYKGWKGMGYKGYAKGYKGYAKGYKDYGYKMGYMNGWKGGYAKGRSLVLPLPFQGRMIVVLYLTMFHD